MVRFRRSAVVLLVLALVAMAGACGGSDSSTPTLNWYINPDNGGQATLAANCTEAANGRYRIETSLLPNDADGQREQLVRRLAANDSSIDLMSLDVAYVPEFAEAGFLRTFEDPTVVSELTEGVLDGPLKTAMWKDKLVAAPFYGNTQLLWYRKSVAERAGLDLENDPAVWDQMIDAAVQTSTTVEVTGARYEGYMVLINALVASAGGEILHDAEAGRDATPELDTDAGKTATGIIQKLATSSAADPQIDTAIEENARLGFQADNGGFMINWPYVYQAAKTAVEDGSLDQAVFDDIAWARFPQSVAGTTSAPPVGGIDLGVGAFTDHPDLAVEAVRCLTSVDSGVTYMLAEGNSGARAAVFDDPRIQEQFPMADLIRDSIDTGGLRPQTEFYTDVSSAVTREYSPPRSVNADTTPLKADEFVHEVLEGKRLV